MAGFWQEQPGSGRRESNSLRNRVFEVLERKIVEGEYPPGMNLTEKWLSEELGVSRTPLREAFGQLEQEGLVTSVPNKGVMVVGISEQDIADIYTIKVTIDGVASRLAAERITPAEIAELEEIISLTEFYVQRKNLDKMVELDSQFHDTILRAGKNRPLRTMLASFHNLAKMARSRSLSNPGRCDKMLEEHRSLLQAIAAGNGDLAERLATEHTVRARESIEAAMQKEK